MLQFLIQLISKSAKTKMMNANENNSQTQPIYPPGNSACEIELNNILNNVNDEKTFLVFVSALIEDKLKSTEAEKSNPSSPYGPNTGGWENTSIESFLSAGYNWASDSDFGRNQKFQSDNPWRQFANFLMAAKVYE